MGCGHCVRSGANWRLSDSRERARSVANALREGHGQRRWDERDHRRGKGSASRPINVYQQNGPESRLGGFAACRLLSLGSVDLSGLEKKLIYRELGRTGLRVSAIGLGTVELGMEYGIAPPEVSRQPRKSEALAVLRRAAQVGINFFDTAPGYGESEELLGEALREFPQCYIATKVGVRNLDGSRPTRSQIRQAVHRSLERSLLRLGREVLDIALIHNATLELLDNGELLSALLAAKQQGKVRFLGTSVYTEAEALAAIETGLVDMLQVPYNILDQTMEERVFPFAKQAGVGIVVRSALLKGLLTRAAEYFPPELTPLRQAAERARSALSASWDSLPTMALRFCISAPQASATLVGVRSQEELEQAIGAWEAGPFPPELMSLTPSLAASDKQMLNPSKWPAL
jgi:aryl-alcohol dehydrogenase-like predicted oxidoreductase